MGKFVQFSPFFLASPPNPLYAARLLFSLFRNTHRNYILFSILIMKSFLAFNVSIYGAGKWMWKLGPAAAAAAAAASNSETNPKSLFRRWVFAFVCPLKIINLNQLSGRTDNFSGSAWRLSRSFVGSRAFHCQPASHPSQHTPWPMQMIEVIASRENWKRCCFKKCDSTF